MRSRSGRILAALLALAAAEGAAGCGSAPRPLPPVFTLQEEQAHAGAKAWAKGDLRTAIASQERALLAARSVEDEEGIALRVLDLAALHRAAGDGTAARAALDELLTEPPPLPYPGRLRAEAARLAGLLALDAGDTAEGTRQAAFALELCRKASCPGRGAIVNLQGRAAFLSGDAEGAIRLARQALPLNREAGDKEEQANSSRIIADAELSRGRHDAAGRAYASALAIDKKLGLSSKILADLVGLGDVARGAGRPGEARGYYERARATARAAKDTAGEAEADARISGLAPPR